MPWIDQVAQQAGPLADVAQRFAAHHGFGADLDPQAMLVGLARMLEHDRSEDERALVEGAGALLGVILIAHHNGRYRGRDNHHRCELRPHVTFDPFAAIERVMDAGNVRRELARQVQLAEQEATAQGPVSLVIHELSTQLERSGLPHRISEVFDTTAWLGPDIQVDLGRVIEATREGVPVARAVRRVVDSLAGAQASEALPWSEARKRLLPRIVNDAFLETLPEGGRELCTQPFAAGLHVALTVSYERRARYLRNAEVDRWGVTPSTAQREALKHLARRSEHTRLGRIDGTHGTMVIAKTGDGLDSARVLLPGLMELLRQELGTPFRIALPHRDTLIACAAGDAALAASVHDHAREQARKAPHAISDVLWWVGAADGLSRERR